MKMDLYLDRPQVLKIIAELRQVSEVATARKIWPNVTHVSHFCANIIQLPLHESTKGRQALCGEKVTRFVATSFSSAKRRCSLSAGRVQGLQDWVI